MPWTGLTAGLPTVGIVPRNGRSRTRASTAVTGAPRRRQRIVVRLLAVPRLRDRSVWSAHEATTVPVATLTMFTKPCVPPVLAVPVARRVMPLIGSPAASRTTR